MIFNLSFLFSWKMTILWGKKSFVPLSDHFNKNMKISEKRNNKAEKSSSTSSKNEDLRNKNLLLFQSNPVHKKILVFIHNGKAVCNLVFALQYIDEDWNNKPFLPYDPYLKWWIPGQVLGRLNFGVEYVCRDSNLFDLKWVLCTYSLIVWLSQICWYIYMNRGLELTHIL